MSFVFIKTSAFLALSATAIEAEVGSTKKACTEGMCSAHVSLLQKTASLGESLEFGGSATKKCADGMQPHQDYPEVCIKSVLRNVDLSCPVAGSLELRSLEAYPQTYPHDLMTTNCPDAVLTTQCMTKDTYNNIADAIAVALNSLDDTCTNSNCEKADWAGCVLRMSGHDFMDFDSTTGKGGSDGCTDMSHADNKGLAPCLYEGEHGFSLRHTYEQFCTTVSLADFLVVAAEAVMHSLGGPAFQNKFKYGRTTMKECPDAASHLPNPENGCSAVQQTFIKNMNLDWRGATALMGVHTLGRAKPQNSGYSGWWSDPKNSRTFNNDYFVSLRNKGWQPNRAVCGNEQKNQWVMTGSTDIESTSVPYGDATEMMLDTDMCLAFHIERGAVGEDCCAWLNRCHGGTGADDEPEINWITKINAAGENVSNPNGCWHLPSGRNGRRSASLTSPNQLCGRRDVADCGTRAQEGGEFMGPIITKHGNKCEEKDDGRWHCSTSSSLSGIAHEYVTEFSADQEAWFDAFLAAWDVATTNGFTSLQSLQDTCQ